MIMKLNLTSSLASTKTLLQVGTSNAMEWDDICNAFQIWHDTNLSNDKDAYGFNIGEFKQRTREEWRIKLYMAYLKIEEKYERIKNLHNMTKVERGTAYKYKRLRTEEDRLGVLAELFPGDVIKRGIHRLSGDLINKQSINIDIDNKVKVIPGQYIPKPLEPYELLSKIESVKYIAYSTFSSIPAYKKFRVIIPTDRPYTKQEGDKLRHFFMLTTSVRNHYDYYQNIVDTTCFEWPRFFYIPVNKSLENAWIRINTPSKFLCVNEVLTQYSKMRLTPHETWKSMNEKRKTIKNA